jgi:Nif-specific regulatory protein
MIEHIEKWLLIEALREHGNNKSATAKTLGITREGLHKKLKGYGIGIRRRRGVRRATSATSSV